MIASALVSCKAAKHVLNCGLTTWGGIEWVIPIFLLVSINTAVWFALRRRS